MYISTKNLTSMYKMNKKGMHAKISLFNFCTVALFSNSNSLGMSAKYCYIEQKKIAILTLVLPYKSIYIFFSSDISVLLTNIYIFTYEIQF